jgi:hypothetical protein
MVGRLPMLNPDRLAVDCETARQIERDIAHYEVLLKPMQDECARMAVRRLITEMEDQLRRMRHHAGDGSVA